MATPFRSPPSKAAQTARERLAGMPRELQAKDRRRRLAMIGAATAVVLAIAGAVRISIVRERRATSLSAMQSYTVK